MDTRSRRQTPRRRRAIWDRQLGRRCVSRGSPIPTSNANFHLTVAIHVSPSLTGLQCQNRYTKSINPALRRGAWSPEEDALLKAAVDGYGQSWNQVSTCVPGRTNDQCRERFLDQLAGSDRGKGKGKDDTWSEEDDKKLLEAVAELGRAWKTVSARVGVGKTGQSVCFFLPFLKAWS